MARKVKDLLEQEITEEFGSLVDIPYGTQEHSEAISNIATLYKAKIEEEKIEKEAEEKRIQLEEAKKDRWIRIGIEGAKVAVSAAGLVIGCVMMDKGWEFEKSNIIAPKGTLDRFMSFFKPFKW